MTLNTEDIIDYLNCYSVDGMDDGIDLFIRRGDRISRLMVSNNTDVLMIPNLRANSTPNTVHLKTKDSDLNVQCNCSTYKRYASCEHIAAALLFRLKNNSDYCVADFESMISDLSEVGFIETEDYELGITPTAVKKPVKLVNKTTADVEWQAFNCTSSLLESRVNNLAGFYNTTNANSKKISLISQNLETCQWTFAFRENSQTIYDIDIVYDKHVEFKYRCTCGTSGHYTMCLHVKAAFDILPENYFQQFRDMSLEKNKILQAYGLTVDDPEAAEFKFLVNYSGELYLSQAPPGLLRIDSPATLRDLNKVLKPSVSSSEHQVERPKKISNNIIDFEAGFVLNVAGTRLPIGIELETAKVSERGNTKDMKKLLLNKAETPAMLGELDDETFSLLMQLNNENLSEHLKSKGYNYFGNTSNPFANLTEGSLGILRSRYLELLKSLWPSLSKQTHTFLLEEGKFSNSNCKPVKFETQGVSLAFDVSVDDRFIIMNLKVKGDECWKGQRIKIYQSCIFKFGDGLHMLENLDDRNIVARFPAGSLKIAVGKKLEFFQNVIAPLQEKYPVDLPPGFDIISVKGIAAPQVFVKEFSERHLMLVPQYKYEEKMVDYEQNPPAFVQHLADGSIELTERDELAEKNFFESLRTLHPSFAKQRQNDFFYLPFEEVMQKNWFINTVKNLQEQNVTVLGIQELKRFRYNTNYPKWDMKASSGIDWFDIKIEVSFGEQVVPLRDIKKAVLNKQNMVVLGDGTFGVLPEEWLKQYGMLLKMGEEQKDGTLQVSKLHYTLIDELHAQIDDEEVLKEIELKKQLLKNIDSIKTSKVPKQIKADLRPYQLSGFNWLQVLDELGWGGCLADDMGLGKTLQAITFLQHLKNKYAESTHLVVCPTSLIYNWENELKKFAPKLKYHIYYGVGREFTDEHFENYDIILTSYGHVRNDMEELLKFEWHYVILDESQAIKNPEAQTTKAVQLLKCRNRIIMSGTPVQNNSMDLFAQFNFINRGLLGNKEFYKNELSTPIDKYNDSEKSSDLKRLVYPFLLRRTKEQVAKDLPDKTETILWCEMPSEQRAVYEDYKNYYREMLMKKIAEEGMAKSGIYVLEGLLRLRQICDSPALVKDNEVTTTQSVKIAELLRELKENTGNHKLLVFSQFTEMLALIAAELQKQNIIFSYLDGSTPAKKRQEAVDNFQNDPAIKVFLISLKAGGVGLNLTAADYVYLVDPWWNPAVEQQAIDRTHRIGQTQKIFAYKLICRNTVEEKIIQLQEKKKQLANDLVTEDGGFVKKLTKEDVEFLFS